MGGGGEKDYEGDEGNEIEEGDRDEGEWWEG